MKLIFTLFISLFFIKPLFCNNFQDKTIELIVGFSKGGATYEMAKEMKVFLAEELKTTVNIKYIEGEASLKASLHLLEKPSAYKIYASTFVPYLANNILLEQAPFKIKDFHILNFQWFDYDLFAVNKTSKYNSLLEIINTIKKKKEKRKIGVIKYSSGHLVLKLLMKKYNIKKEDYILKTYVGGEKLRKALLKKDISLMIAPAQGSEKYKKEIKALAVNTNKRTKRWDADTLIKTLKDDNISFPLIYGSIRGFAISKQSKKLYAKEYKLIQKAFRKILAKKRVQKILSKKRIGYSWIGESASNELLLNSYETFKNYNYLIQEK